MILCGDTTDVSGGGVGAGGGCPPQKDIRWREGKAGRDKYKYVTISDRAKVPEGSTSEVGTPPPHDSDTLHGLVASNTHTHTHILA